MEPNRRVIATDLDRTLIPNGIAKDTNSVQKFTAFLHQKPFNLIYVTARSKDSVLRAIDRYKLPIPHIIIGQVGTTIHVNKNGNFTSVQEWEQKIRKENPLWDRETITNNLCKIPQLQLQAEKEQNRFKLSYIFQTIEERKEYEEAVITTVNAIARESATVIISDDLNAHLSYVDILPKTVSKLTALKFVIYTYNLVKSNVLCAGDSENDYSMLLSDLTSVVVGNASEDVKDFVTKNKIGTPPIISQKNYSEAILDAIKILKW